LFTFIFFPAKALRASTIEFSSTNFQVLPGLSLLGKFPQNGEIGGFLGSDLGNRIFWGNFWGIF
jgi:hypothetical protein